MSVQGTVSCANTRVSIPSEALNVAATRDFKSTEIHSLAVVSGYNTILIIYILAALFKLHCCAISKY